jgi:hypothetical protein
MNRLEMLKLKLAEKHYKDTGHVPTDWALINFYAGFEAASAEYEKIIAELNKINLKILVRAENISQQTCHALKNNMVAIGNMADEALQKLRDFKND